MDDRSCNLLFVYGTLMQGMGNSFSDELTEGSEYLGSATVPGRLYDVKGEYPCAVTSSHSPGLILGEIYRLKNPVSLFQSLDLYEDCYPEDASRSLFIRTLTRITASNKQTHTAWIYLWNRPLDGLSLIENGDYRSWRNRMA